MQGTKTIKQQSNKLYRLTLIILIITSCLVLVGCPQKPSFPQPITPKTTPTQATRYLSWHLRTNLIRFNKLAKQLNRIKKLKHFQPQTQQAINSLINSGMWQTDHLSYQLQQRFSQTVTQLGIHSILKKGDSLVMHMGSATDNNINSQYNLVFKQKGLIRQGYVANSSKDRLSCQRNYLTTQYPNTSFGSCYVKLAKGWYIHHSYQHL